MYWYAIDWLDAISLFLDPVEAILRETETILGKSRDGQGNPPGVFLGRLIPTPLYLHITNTSWSDLICVFHNPT